MELKLLRINFKKWSLVYKNKFIMIKIIKYKENNFFFFSKTLF